MIIDGNKTAERILEEVEREIKEKQLTLKLAVVLVGDNEMSKTYIEKKREAAKKIGVGFELFSFAKEIPQKQLEITITEIAQKKDINGIVIQLPLPSHINTDKILDCVPKEKDVEGFVSSIHSPIVEAIKEFFREYKISLQGKEILIIGKGKLVGKPVAKWLKEENVDFKIIDKSVENISFYTKKADIIITGTGNPNLIKEEMVKDDVTIIDAGTCKLQGKTMGDVDFENVCQKAKCITPCIGGIGPVTVACLFKNLLKLKQQNS